MKLPNLKNPLKTMATMAIAMGSVFTSTIAEAITLDITYAPGTSKEQITAVEMAKNVVSSYLTDTDIKVNIYVQMNSQLPEGYLALATPGINNLVTYAQFNKFKNPTSNATNYKVLEQTGLVTTRSIISMTNANYKVLNSKLNLNLTSLLYNGLDGYIQFNSNFSWNYNYTQTPQNNNQYDLTSIAIHEIFHVLGVVSAIDPSNLVNSLNPTCLDLYRYSSQSAGQGAIDFRQGGTSYLSSDAGQTAIGNVSTGTNILLFGGDGYQTSHWKNNPANPMGMGVMNPTQFAAQKLSVTNSDLQMLKLIGYDVNQANPDLTALYNQAQNQANTATIKDQTLAVTTMMLISGVYPARYSSRSTSSGWWERAEEHDYHGKKANQH